MGCTFGYIPFVYLDYCCSILIEVKCTTWSSISTVELITTSNIEVFELTLTSTSRNKVTADDVLLHAFEVVGLTADGGFVEHLGGLLEGGG